MAFKTILTVIFFYGRGNTIFFCLYIICYPMGGKISVKSKRQEFWLSVYCLKNSDKVTVNDQTHFPPCFLMKNIEVHNYT